MKEPGRANPETQQVCSFGVNYYSEGADEEI
jgi:hypothetical protein